MVMSKTSHVYERCLNLFKLEFKIAEFRNAEDTIKIVQIFFFHKENKVCTPMNPIWLLEIFRSLQIKNPISILPSTHWKSEGACYLENIIYSLSTIHTFPIIS
jgi:hypothetical protein